MSLLTPNTTPAERLRGCTFCDLPHNNVQVGKNGGHLFGSPTFSESGMTLDGTNDYAKYDLTGTEFDSDPISIVIEFTPDFDHDENAERYIIDTTNGEEYSVVKKNNAASNVLSITLGNTLIANIAEATYSPSWAVGERHVLVVSGTTGDTDAWLINSTGGTTQILTANATAWTADTPADLYVGAEQASGSKFDGTVHGIRVFKARLTAEEAQDFYDESMYTYEEGMIEFPLTYAHHGATVNDNTDVYQMAIHGAPVKLANRGYSFDGAADYLLRADDDSFDMDLANNPTGDFSFQCVITPHTVTGVHGILTKDNIGATRAITLYQNGANVFFHIWENGGGNTPISRAPLIAHDLAFITATYHYITSGTSQMRLYVNNLAASISDVAVGPVRDTTSGLSVGAYSNGANKFSGRIHDCRIYKGIVLTELQHLDYMQRMKRKLQDI